MAGKAKRSAARERRRSEMRAKKAARKAQYEVWKKAGVNTKSKRVRLRQSKQRKLKQRLSRHAKGPCGNVGCRKCNPIPQNLFTPTQCH